MENISYLNWAAGLDPSDPYPGIDGGDLGNPEKPSVWIFGLEPGNSIRDQKRRSSKPNGHSIIDNDYSIETQMKWGFNQAIFKLLCSLNGQDPSFYKEFAYDVRPFQKGYKGYLKGNVYPEQFNNMKNWDMSATKTTGFQTKKEYQVWCNNNRIPFIRSLIKKHRPKMFLGIGLMCQSQFKACADAPSWETYNFFVDGVNKRILYSLDGTVPAFVLPHLNWRQYSLYSDESIKIASNFIREQITNETITCLD